MVHNTTFTILVKKLGGFVQKFRLDEKPEYPIITSTKVYINELGINIKCIGYTMNDSDEITGIVGIEIPMTSRFERNLT